jgi:competence protein ComGC
MSKTAKNVLVAIPVIVLLLVIAIPNFIKPRGTISRNACANNLFVIQAAKKHWALEKQKTTNDVPTWEDLLPYLDHGHMDGPPTCPSGGVYTIGKAGEPVKCSIGGVGHTLDSN